MSDIDALTGGLDTEAGEERSDVGVTVGEIE